MRTLAQFGQEQRGPFSTGSGRRIQIAPPRGRHVRSLHPFRTLRQLNNSKKRSRPLLSNHPRTAGPQLYSLTREPAEPTRSAPEMLPWSTPASRSRTCADGWSYQTYATLRLRPSGLGLNISTTEISRIGVCGLSNFKLWRYRWWCEESLPGTECRF